MSGIKLDFESNENLGSFRAQSECEEEELKNNYKTVVGKILENRDVTVVTKKDRLLDLISDAVELQDRNYVKENLNCLMTFMPEGESIEAIATQVPEMPSSVARDLAESSEFLYGNLWFLLNNSNQSPYTNLLQDITKLYPSSFRELPILEHEALASPAMNDGLRILWFNPDKGVCENKIQPLFQN